jgi:hypothetical protein
MRPGRGNGLRVPLYQKIDASAQPLEIGARGHAGEGRAVELACRGLCKGGGRLLRPLDTAAARDDLVKPQHLARQAAFARPRQEAADPRSVRAIGVTQRVREQKGPFAFPEITVDFLAVARNIPVEVQDVVGDLEGQPEQVAEAIEAIEFLIVSVGDECADPHGVNEATRRR